MAETPAEVFPLRGARIYVAGHRGMVGSACVRRLEAEGCAVVTADRLVDYVTVNGGVFLDNLRFGSRTPPSPSNALSVGAVKTNRRTGSASVAVSVPGVGTTTLEGKHVASVSVDSARARTVSLPVAVTGALRDRLRQRGRVTVHLTVTYAPAGGTPASRPVTVKLKLKR